MTKEIFFACEDAIIRMPETAFIFQLKANTDNLIEKAKDVTKKWLQTEEGKEYFESEGFMDWHDFFLAVPDSFCNAHGLYRTEICNNPICINSNESLLE